MKLIVAIVQDKDVVRLLEALVANGFRATKLATSGGFLKQGNTTLLIGVDEAKVDAGLDVIRSVCQGQQEKLVSPLASVSGPMDSYIGGPVEVSVGGATIFVLDVEHYESI